MNRWVLIAVAAAASLVVGCSQKPSEAIVGSWQNAASFASQMEFRADGSWSAYQLSGAAYLAGTHQRDGHYTFVDEHTVRLTIDQDGEPVDAGTIRVSFTDDTMSVVRDDGRQQIWKRIGSSRDE